MKNIKVYIIGLLISLSLQSCVNELEKHPYNQLSKDQSFTSIDDASYWINGMYALLRSNIYGAELIPTEIQADQLNATLDFGNNYGDFHRWDGLDNGVSEVVSTWSNKYTAIANINVAIEGFEKMQLSDPNDQAKLSQYKGEAHLARAYYYFQLVRRYSKAYNPSTSNTDLGLPIVLNYDLDFKPNRSTLQATYAQILSDIEVAKVALANIPGKPMDTRFSIDFVYSLEARVKLFMQDWSGAKSAAEKVITSGKYSLANTREAVFNLWRNDDSSEIIYQSYVSRPDELPTTLGFVFLQYRAGEKNFTPLYVPSQWIIDAYDEKDFRKSAYFEQLPVVIGGINTNAYLVAKYKGNPAYQKSQGVFNYVQAPKAFRLAEMYLISAEASIMLNDPAGKTRLNELRNARGLQAINNPTLQDLKNERMKELAFEGFRLDDLKRWGDRITRKAPQSLSYIQNTPLNQYYQLDRPANDNKTTWGLPNNDIKVNGNLKQNPGW